ncbi:testis-expressed protein 47 isoform X2 [Fundulus heteroclitus]|uniref:testis-expressed protein 47 isoform X2 n=1 Tax=Fundulus heteroclitus TaxID=8078 RepID=UPI00165B7148|nr:testis-expressed protein 47 isoform X2 [Fundulus heteroclitus]
MSNACEGKSFPSNSWNAMEEEEDRSTMFDAVYGRMTEKVVLQQLIMVARLPCDPADRTELGASYENFNVHLSKQHMWDQGITGLLLMYPTCLLHVIEASEHMLNCFLKDFQAMQQQPDCTQLEAKVVFVGHNLEGRQFQQWRYEVMNAGPDDGNPLVRMLDEDEDSIESLVCSVLTSLQNLVPHVETIDKAFPGSVLDENQEILIPAVILEMLLGRDELLSPQQYHQMYHNPLNINPEYGQVNLRYFF